MYISDYTDYMNKTDLRAAMVARRLRLSDDEARVMSVAIAKRLQAQIRWEQVTHLHVYRSRHDWHEVDTRWVEAFVYAIWPHIQVTVGDALATAAVPKQQFDVILVPMVAFDDRLNRLGLGGGWYDRFLATQPNAVAIGLAYGFQRVSQLAVESHDAPMATIVTESSVYG